MLSNNIVRRMACYAVLQSGFTSENYLNSHLRLVLNLLYQKNYKVVKIEKVIKDFLEEYQYEIPIFPMRAILGMACSQGYIEKKPHHKEYLCSNKINSLQNMQEEIENCEKDFSCLSNEYKTFIKEKYQKKISIEQAQIVVAEQVCIQKLEQITNRLDLKVNDGSSRYFFACFQKYLRTEKNDSFVKLRNICVGSILADYLTYNEEMDKKSRLNGLTVVLDTPVVFMFLGIDPLREVRNKYYASLVESAISNGAKIVIFRRTYDEMQKILAGTIEWVENKEEYDPSLASITTEYFRSKNATKTDVIEFSNELKDTLVKKNIEILDWEYSKQSYQFNPDVGEIQQLLKVAYDNQNSEYNENSVELDANSIAGIYILRGQAKPQHLVDSKFIFVTFNTVLAKVATDYHTNVYSKYVNSEHTFETVVTDTFFGTYMWLSNPTRINDMNNVRMLANAYVAIQPSTLMLRKIVNAANKLYDDKQITEKDCYLLKGDMYVREKIMQKTFGNPENFTEQTPLEIMNEIRQEARSEGRNEAIKEKELEITRINNIHNEENLKHYAFEKELLEDKKKNLIDTKKSKEEKKKKIEEKWRYLRWIIGVTVICIAVIIICGDNWFQEFELEKNFDKFLYIASIVGYGLYMFCGKKIDFLEMPLKWINNLKTKELFNKQCRECDIESVQKDIEITDNLINRL